MYDGDTDVLDPFYARTQVTAFFIILGIRSPSSTALLMRFPRNIAACLDFPAGTEKNSFVLTTDASAVILMIFLRTRKTQNGQRYMKPLHGSQLPSVQSKWCHFHAQQSVAAVDPLVLCKQERVSIVPAEDTLLEQEKAGESHSQSMT